MAEEENSIPNQYAIDALTAFVSKYEPATFGEADVFFSTGEISDSIFELTGQSMTTSEVYKLMTDMNYSYQPMNGLNFSWMLKKV